jgi:REP element-mobilizing transposase RayT
LKYDPSKHQRRSIRRGGFDYTTPGAYFVTIVVRNRECRLGDVTPEAVMRLNDLGQLVQAEWEALPRRFACLRLDEYVIMPNHLHGLMVLTDEAGSEGTAKSEERDGGSERSHGTQSGSLGAMVQNFKAVSTRRINIARHTPGAPFWQRNY